MSDQSTPLASLVMAGEAQAKAIAINDFIYMSQDISNAYLVTTGGDNVLVNAGMPTGAARHKALFDAISAKPVAYAVVTQSHPDHFGGLPAFVTEATHVVVQRRFDRSLADREPLLPFFRPRTGKLWGNVISAGQMKPPAMAIKPDIIVDDHFAFAVGGRRFEVLATPGGETLDSLSVWLPDDKVVFTGNLFGPIFLHLPNLYTIRGERLRPALEYVRSLDRIAALGAELLVTGHGEPIRGAKAVADGLARMRAAVMHLHDATVAGMNAGKDVHTLMREITVPADLGVGEGHGKAAWNVRSIWEEYAGWFHYDSTTSLYGVPQSSVHADLVELSGGSDALAARARLHLDGGRPLEALHLTDIVLGREPAHHDALVIKRDASALLLERSGSSNLSETMWLKSEVAAAEAALQQHSEA